ncbi:MAG: hypothetical protein IKJ68_08845, partial [Clostridia bacterium]|nr:hypothetical protein [Clostridia bacterium]
MNITSNKIITNTKGYLEKFKKEIFMIYLFPLISSLVYYIYILIKVNTKNSTLIFDVTSTRFISFIITVLGIYGFSCFQNKPFFTKLITIFCSMICWLLNFPITKSYINSMDQKNPNWNLLVFFQILYSILIIVLLFILRSLSKNQYSNRFVGSINQISYKEKIALVLLFIGVLALLCIISNSSSAFQITLLFLEVIIGTVFTYINKNLFSPKTVDFSELKLKTKVIDSDKYKVFFCFANNTININDCYKILISNIKIE